MLALFILRSALSTFSAVFGGLGVYFVIKSFDRPHLAIYALMFLGIATAIELTTKRAN